MSDYQDDEEFYDEVPTVKERFEMEGNQCYHLLEEKQREVAQKVASREDHRGRIMIAMVIIIILINILLVGLCVAIAVQVFTSKTASTHHEEDSISAVLKNSTSVDKVLTQRIEDLMSIVLDNFTSVEKIFMQLTRRIDSKLNSTEGADDTAELEASLESLLENFNIRVNTAINVISTNLAQKMDAQTESLNSSFSSQVSGLVNRTQQQFCARTVITSCAALPLFSPSGHYWIRTSNDAAVRVYCDMTRSCGGVTGGWMRVAHLDMTNTSHQCPSGLMERTVPPQRTEPRTCVSTYPLPGCSASFYFETFNFSYSRVCGKVIGYQKGNPNGFPRQQISIDLHYVDGVSFTHGGPREHIWTLAAARDLQNPCPGPGQPPTYVGENYFCDTGAPSSESVTYGVFFADSPLWDCEGEGVECDSSSPPWFYRHLPHTTTDNIEMRVCRNERQAYEDVAIETIELYIQ